MKQTDIILRELRLGRTVSKLSAVHMGIGNIHEVVRRLRHAGHDIRTRSDSDGLDRVFTKYVLVSGGDGGYVAHMQSTLGGAYQPPQFA